MRGLVLLLGTLVLLAVAALLLSRAGADVVVGSKNFAESYVLGEVMAQLLEDRGFRVERRFGLGGTLIGFEALRIGGLALYDPALILEGAIPAALLAVATELTFEGFEKLVIPQHLSQMPVE